MHKYAQATGQQLNFEPLATYMPVIRVRRPAELVRVSIECMGYNAG
jgi:hypothetical protein